MRKVIFALALFIGVTATAQEKKERRGDGEKLSKEERIDRQVKKMTTDLSLNEKQAKEVRAIVTKEVEKREAKRAEAKETEAKRREEMKAKMEEMKKEQAAVDAEMKKVLTDEQYAKWQKQREERKDNFKEKMAERRGKRGAKKAPTDN